MATYTIKDLENFTGIKAHTLRIWEKRYNLVEPKRTDTNIRFYDDEDLKKLLNVSILNRSGFKISNIASFTEDNINEKIINLAQTGNDVESQIEGLVLAMIDMDENTFDKIFNTAVINFGFEETILRLMYPFFHKIGILWQIGTINPAQEHFISNLLRQKLIVAIDGIIQTNTTQSKSFLLFLPEGEFHELGLLFYYYLVKKSNHRLFYLGANVPMAALEEVSNAKKVDYLVTSLITPRTDDFYEEYFGKLSDVFKEQKIFITGLQTETMDFNLPGNFSVLRSAEHMKSTLTKI